MSYIVKITEYSFLHFEEILELFAAFQNSIFFFCIYLMISRGICKNVPRKTGCQTLLQVIKRALPLKLNTPFRRGPVPVAARSETKLCRRSLAGIACSNPAEGMDVCLL